MPQHEIERLLVLLQAPVEYALGGLHEAAGFLLVIDGFQNTRAEHRRERERDEARDEDGHRNRYRELPEHTPDDAAHEQHRNEHANQRHCHRDDGKADLAGAGDRRLEGRHASLDIAIDVLQNDNGVVDDKAHAQDQREQCHIVDGVAENIHRAERADNGKRQGQRRNHRRAPRAQEQEDHQHHQHHGFQKRALDGAHRVADRDRTVDQNFDADCTRHRSPEFRQSALYVVDDIDGVRVGLTVDRKVDRALVVVPARDALVLDAILDDSNVGQLDRGAVAPGDDQILILLRVRLLGTHIERKVLLRAGDHAERRIRRGRGDCLVHFGQRYAARRDRLRIDPNAKRILLAAEYVDLRNARDLRNLLADHGLGVFVHDRKRQRVRHQRQEQNRGIRRVHLAETRRRGHFRRQVALRHRKRGLYVERRGVDVAVEVELNRDLGRSRHARRGHRGDAGDRRKLPLDRGRHRRGDDLGVRTRKRGRDVDRREVYTRQCRDRQQAIAEYARHDDRHHQKRRQHRPANAKFEEVHRQEPA